MRPNDGTARTTPSTRWNPDSSISTPVEQFATYEMRAGMWRNGELVQEEEHALRINFYFKNELLMMLERAGFTDIVVHGDHREEAPT